MRAARSRKDGKVSLADFREGMGAWVGFSAWSNATLPWMSQWLGTQQKIIFRRGVRT